MEDIEKRVIGKVMRRLIPFLILCYFVAYLDRVNVGFAKLHMNQALGLSEAAFGLGAGLFFIGYFLFEVPSNIFLERVGARVWIARIMITWGIVSAAFAFIPSISTATGIPTDGGFLFSPFAARRLRGGLLSGHHLLPDAVVPGGLSRSGDQPVHAGDPDFFDHRITNLRDAARRDGLGAGRLAVAVHYRGVAVGSGGHRRPDLSDRFSATGPLAAKRRDRLAGRRAGDREEKQGEGRTPFVVAGAYGSPHFAVRSGVFLPECRKLRRGLLPADHHQGFWRERYPDRIAGRAAVCFRGHRHGAARPSF